MPPTARRLVPAYKEAERRFGVGTGTSLPRSTMVESSFGQARNDSGAGAKGPMQFIPSSWRIYGLGGNVDDPHDAVIGAANLLSHAGAPASYGRALYSYNASTLYVDAVQRYARLIAADRQTLFLLYSWPTP